MSNITIVGRGLSALALNEHIHLCTACGLHQNCINKVPGAGNVFRPDIMFIGEAPGAEESLTGQPFVGKSGQELTRLIRAMHYTRDEVFITNILKCRPPDNRNPEENEVTECRPFLEKQIDLINPRVIVLVGLQPTIRLVGLPENTKMRDVRGIWSKVTVAGREYQAMPTYHPSYLIRNGAGSDKPPSETLIEIKKMVWQDMTQVLDYLKGSK